MFVVQRAIRRVAMLCALASVAILGIALRAEAIPESVLLWNTLGSSTEIENSEVGPDGTYGGGTGFPVGPPAAQGDFENAYEADATQSSPLTSFPLSALPTGGAGTIEFWARLGGMPSSIPPSDSPAMISLNSGGLVLRFNPNDGLGGGGLCGVVNTGNPKTACTDGYGSYTYSDILGAGVADWHHYALVWDTNGIFGVDNGNRDVAVFLDGALESGLFYDAGGSIGAFTSGSLGLVRGDQLTSGNVAIDDLIIYDYAKTYFGDRSVPGPVPEPGTALLLGAALTGLAAFGRKLR
jgi:hypothetical protein